MGERYDVVVIGGGPGGYPAAVHAAHLGGSVALIEKGRLGGTCLQVGCIPTKALYESAMIYSTTQRAPDFGVALEGPPTVDFARMMERKTAIVDQLTRNVELLVGKSKVEVYQGTGRLLDARTIQVEGADEVRRIQADHVILATGSAWSSVPGLAPDGKHVLTSDDVLGLASLPRSMVVVGGGVIGCEFATVLSHLGSKVWIVELLERILATEDEDTIAAIRRTFRRTGVDVHTGVSVQNVATGPEGAKLTLSDGKGLQADAVVVAAGRRPYTDGLGIEEVGIERTAKGAIRVDEAMRTSVDGVYAIGDVIGGYMLAHVATREGLVAASHAMGRPARIDYSAVPMVTFTAPQIASVGANERSLKASGAKDYAVGKAFFKASGMAQCMGDTEGFAKIIVDKTRNRILGATLVGPDASNLIAALVGLVGRPIEAVTETIYAHPTLAETIWEAACAAS